MKHLSDRKWHSKKNWAIRGINGRALLPLDDEELYVVSQILPSLHENNPRAIMNFIKITHVTIIKEDKIKTMGKHTQFVGCIPLNLMFHISFFRVYVSCTCQCIVQNHLCMLRCLHTTQFLFDF